MENTGGAAVQDPTTAGSSPIGRPASSDPSQDRLPSLVVLEIFRYLDLKSLVKCRLVCSGFQFLIDSTASLQYKIELEVAGQHDGRYGDMLTRREMLKMHQKRWDGLQWTEVLRVPMLSNYWVLCGGVLSQASTNRHTLHLKRIPSQSRGIKEKNWILDLSILLGEEVSMINFGMDPGQDLLVIIARAGEALLISLLTLSRGEGHPLASDTCLELPRSLEPGRCFIEICQDFFSTHLWGNVIIWNWKTGEVLTHIVDHHYEITSMVFLNERYILMGIMKDMIPYLIAVDFLAESPEPRQLASLKNYFIFRFPAIPCSLPVISITVKSNSRSTWGADTDPPVPFSMVPQNRLIAIGLSNALNGHRLLAIFEASFLRLIKTGLRVNNNSFDWSMWGPEHSRALSDDAYWPGWLLPSHGTRLALKRNLPHRKASVDVYDFNHLECRNKKQDNDLETHENMDVSESSEIRVPNPTRNIFCDQVETRLGYSVTSWSTDASFISVMCSEDAVITVTDNIGIFQIYTV